MSDECFHATMDDTVKQEEIHLAADPEITSESRSSTSPAQTGVVTFKDFLGVLTEELKDVKVNVSGTDNRTIQKVLEIMLRNEDLKKYFKPRELSIGPIHAADSNLFKKELKLKLAAHFVEKCSGRTAEVLLEEFKLNFKDIKTYFDEKVIELYTDEELFRLVFFDGCAMLEFIHSYVNQRLNVFNISNGQAALIHQDLFLLENQIPFQVLAELMYFSKGSIIISLRHSFLRFITMSSIVPKYSTELLPMDYESLCGSSGTKQPDHVLDLHRRMLLSSTHHSLNKFRKLLNFISASFFFVFFISGALICCLMERLNVSHDLPEYWNKMQSFRNVQELKTAGIMFMPTDSLTTISFRSRLFITVQLSLPTLVVDDSTARMLLNMVAYEMCFLNKRTEPYGPDYLKASWVTSYINLLDLLIDNEQDLKD